MRAEILMTQLSQDLMTAAGFYHALGIPVVPFKIVKTDKGEFNKQNIGYWKKWETESQSEEEFKELCWAEANGFGVILGTQAKNGMFLSVIDYDVKGEKVSEEVKLKGKEILKDFPITQTHETVNKGIHYVYWSRNKVKTDGTFHDTAALELLGEKKLCLMPPSMGYRNLNDNSPTELESIEETYYNILKKYGLGNTEEIEVQNQLDNYSFQISKIIDLNTLTKISMDEYQGRHPTHDSTTEKNFCVNIRTNSWHCFRHNSGGGALQFLAVKEGLIKCEQAKKGALRGKKFKEVLQIAVSQGLIDEKILTQSEINPVLLAKDIMEDYIFTVDQDTNTLYYYQEKEGIYSDKTEQLLKREIAKRLDENFKTRYYTEINEFITATMPLTQMNTQNPELLAVKNGLLNVLTREVTPFNPHIFITNKLDVDFDQKIVYSDSFNAKFLSQVVSNEVQRNQIQEIIGHCLYKQILAEVSLVCLGKGGNGKSIFLTTIKQFLGLQNISSYTIQQLCYDKFVIVEIKDKLANICTDLPHKELMSTGTYKALVSGDSVPINIKLAHVKSKTKTIDPYTKYLYSANHIPPIATEEDSYAWYRRFIFADFKVTFTKENAIPRKQLLDQLTTPTEKTALLNWALDGLARLHKAGDVSNKPSVDCIRTEYRKRSSTTLAYFDEGVQVTDNQEDWVFTSDWFRNYVTYCHNNDLKPKSKGEFLKDIEQHLPGVKNTKIRPEPKASPISAWRYVKVVPQVPPVPRKLDLSGKIEKNTLVFFPISGNKVEKRGTSGTGGTELRNCSQCANFRKTTCECDNWEFIPGTENAIGYPCFKRQTQKVPESWHDVSEDYGEKGENY